MKQKLIAGISTVLSLIAIAVSIASYKLSDRESINSDFERQPDFQIQEILEFNSETSLYEQQYLVISKLSGQAKNIGIKQISFINVKWFPTSKPIKKNKFVLLDYYGASSSSSSGTGEIYKSFGYKNNSKLIQFKKKLRESLSKNIDVVDIQRKTYVRINYLDYKRAFKSEYFEVNINGGNLIDEQAGKIIFEEHENLLISNNIINLDRMNDDEYTKIMQNIENQ